MYYVVRVNDSGVDVDVKFFEGRLKARAHAVSSVKNQTGDAFVYSVPADDVRLAEHQFKMDEGVLIETHLMTPNQKVALAAHVDRVLKDLL